MGIAEQPVAADGPLCDPPLNRSVGTPSIPKAKPRIIEPLADF